MPVRKKCRVCFPVFDGPENIPGTFSLRVLLMRAFPCEKRPRENRPDTFSQGWRTRDKKVAREKKVPASGRKTNPVPNFFYGAGSTRRNQSQSLLLQLLQASIFFGAVRYRLPAQRCFANVGGTTFITPGDEHGYCRQPLGNGETERQPRGAVAALAVPNMAKLRDHHQLRDRCVRSPSERVLHIHRGGAGLMGCANAINWMLKRVGDMMGGLL